MYGPATCSWIACSASRQRLSRDYPEDRKYVFEDRGRGGMRTYSREFTKAYEDAMHGHGGDPHERVHHRCGKLLVQRLGECRTADLDRFEQKDVSDSLKAVLKAEDELWRANQKGFGRDHE